MIHKIRLGCFPIVSFGLGLAGANASVFGLGASISGDLSAPGGLVCRGSWLAPAEKSKVEANLARVAGILNLVPSSSGS